MEIKSIEKFKKAQEELEKTISEIKSASIKNIVDEIGEKIGNFAVVFIGYTPSFNDGDVCEHSSEYIFPTKYSQSSWNDLYWSWNNDECDRVSDDYNEFFDIHEEGENSYCINSHLDDNQEVLNLLDILLTLVDEIYGTNYEVSFKYLNGESSVKVDEYDCGY